MGYILLIFPPKFGKYTPLPTPGTISIQSLTLPHMDSDIVIKVMDQIDHIWHEKYQFGADLATLICGSGNPDDQTVWSMS